MTDFLKAELENFLAQYQEDLTQLKEDVRIVGTKRDHFTDEQDLLLSISSSSRPRSPHLLVVLLLLKIVALI
jgi:hypothetical protein